MNRLLSLRQAADRFAGLKPSYERNIQGRCRECRKAAARRWWRKNYGKAQHYTK